MHSLALFLIHWATLHVSASLLGTSVEMSVMLSID